MKIKNFLASALVALVVLSGTATVGINETQAQANQGLYDLLISLGVDQNTAQSIAGMGSTVVTNTSTGTSSYVHSYTLTRGMTAAKVREAQMCLNSLGYNAGPNDSVFGGQTASAVRSFQAANGLTQDMVIGINTGTALQQACAGGSGPVVIPPVVTQPPVINNGGQIVFYSGQATDIDNENVRDGDDDNVEECEQGQEIIKLTFDVEDADAGIEDVHYMFESQSGENDPWKVFEELTVKINGQTVGSMDTDSSGDWDDFSDDISDPNNNDEYVVSFYNVNTVVAEDTEVEITLEADIDCSADQSSWKIWVAEAPTLLDGVEIVDGSGSTHYTGSISSNEFATVDVDFAGANAEFVVSSNSNDPDAAVLEIASNTNKTHMVFVYDVESEEDDAMVEDMYLWIALTDGSGNAITDQDDFDEVIKDITIDGAGLSNEDMTDYSYDSGIGAWFIEFENVDLDLDADDEEEIEVTVELDDADTGDLYPVTGGTITGTTFFLKALASDHDPETDNGDSIVSSGSATSETHTILTDGMNVSLDSATSDAIDSTAATVGDKLICKHFVDVVPFSSTGTVYVPVAGAVGAMVDIIDASGNVISAPATSISIVSSANQIGTGATAEYEISSSETLEVTVDYLPGAGQYYCQLTEISFAETSGGALTPIPLTNYNTPVQVVN